MSDIDASQINATSQQIVAMQQRIDTLERENRRLKAFISWEDDLFSVDHSQLSAAHKLTLWEACKQVASQPGQGLKPIKIWKIAKQKGLSEKTVGRVIGFLDKIKVLIRREKHDQETQHTQVLIEPLEAFLHPKRIRIDKPRNHGGYQVPKCKACGGDLEVETSVYCTACGVKHIVSSRPVAEHDLVHIDRFHDLMRLDKQLSKGDGSRMKWL